MKYGIYFLLLAALMLSITIHFGGWYWITVYPALSFAIVALGYLGIGPRVFGKRLLDASCPTAGHADGYTTPAQFEECGSGASR
jgi:hypothetical protein